MLGRVFQTISLARGKSRWVMATAILFVELAGAWLSNK